MPISISQSYLKSPGSHRTYDTVEPLDLNDFAHIICSRVWSPIIWVNGERSRGTFLESSYMVLDYDTPGLPMSETIQYLDTLEIGYIVATTKSHQKEKVSTSGLREPPCDRYRVILRAETCARFDLYEYTMINMSIWLGTDRSCKDAARFFYPCITVASAKPGAKAKWLPYDEDYVPEHVRNLNRNTHILQRYSREILPDWIKNILLGREIVTPGNRHRTCYKLGAWLTTLGYSIDEVVKLLATTTLVNIGLDDLERAVRNGSIASEQYS